MGRPDPHPPAGPPPAAPRPCGARRPPARWRRLAAHLRRLLPRPPLLGLICRAAALLVSAALAVRYPTVAVIGIATWLWVLWPVCARRRTRGAVQTVPGPQRQHSLAIRYLGGHPGLERAGAGRLRAWPDDGAAELAVGRASVAFPLAAVQAVTLVEGRVLLHTGCRGWLASVVGRLLALGTGKFCGLRRHGDEDLAVVDRSRVLCDLQRQGRPCRVVLTGPRGGGEDVYLEALVMLRPVASWREPGPADGSRGAATSPPQVG